MTPRAPARRRFTRVAPLLPILAIVLFPTTAPAAMYKCVDAEGNITYTGTRCPTADARVESVTGVRTRGAPLACGIVRNFAWQTASAMKRGRSSSAAFDAHGGIGALSPTAISIVSYVYEFQGNERASASRVTELAVGRCQGRSFGAVGCDAFPSGFVAALGGCEGAHVFGGLTPRGGPSRPVAVRAERAASATARTSFRAVAPAADASARVADARARCRARVTDDIERTNDDMRASHSVSGQDRLRERRRRLGRELGAC